MVMVIAIVMVMVMVVVMEGENEFEWDECRDMSRVRARDVVCRGVRVGLCVKVISRARVRDEVYVGCEDESE